MGRQRRTVAPLELWGGVECTVNRVGNVYFDQLERTGHVSRASDLDLFATLGVSALRYPLLWERIAPGRLEDADWGWADDRLHRLRQLGIRPIIGLVHHGSGPRHTSLIDSSFPTRLAAYARAVARRYPWAECFTPVNEPLTTARFSGLYGHWFPHGRDGLTFGRALLTQCRAIVLAMRAIREVIPTARLIQTEDLGKTFSTPALNYQAEFENERRWLTFDLLTGRVGPEHAMWSYLRWVGISEDDLRWFIDNPCAPDILGINHYLTSERFIDDRLERYPRHTHGGNGRHAYADVEAVRVCAEGLAGAQTLLREVWERYRLPVAITEAHLNCTREEQLRWLKEIWDAARDIRSAGADVRAVTAWSMLGAYDWDSLLTSAAGHYESGVFDIRAPQPRPTALAAMLRNLATAGTYEHPVISAPGWWRRPGRLCYPAVHLSKEWATKTYKHDVQKRSDPVRPLLITGATGTLGRAFARLCQMRGLTHHLLSRQETDIADARSVANVLEKYRPWALVNAAGYVRVDDAEREPERCFRENTEGAARLAEACAHYGVELLTFSSDLVFDGVERDTPYLESDQVAPLNIYGRSKAEAEQRVLSSHPTALVVRTSAFFSPWDDYNFATVALRTLAAGQAFIAASDAIVSATYVPDLVNTCLDLLIDGECGIWHLANQDEMTWAELVRLTARLAKLDATGIIAIPTHALKLAATRPLYSALGSARGTMLPSVENALARYVRACGKTFNHAPAQNAHKSPNTNRRVPGVPVPGTVLE